MALPVPATLLVVVGLAVGSVGVRAQGAAPAPAPPAAAAPATASAADPGETSLSPECRVPGSQLFTIAKLKAVKTALREHRAIHVLALGPAASPSFGVSAPYPVRLESELTKSFPGVAVDVESRTLSGEIAADAADRLRTIVADIEPDLVIWQVGSNDALARVDLDGFAQSLDASIAWVKSHDIDLVLVDPQYTASLAKDEYYGRFVQAIRTAAAKAQIPLVQRYEATRYLAAAGGRGTTIKDQFRLSDLSWRCMAEHVTRAITVSLLEPEAPAPHSALVPTAPPGQAGAR